MTNLKLALACGMLLAAISVTNHETSVTPAQPFWQMHGAGPVSMHELESVAELRDVVREELSQPMLLAAR
jgi:hypothetical protein